MKAANGSSMKPMDLLAEDHRRRVGDHGTSLDEIKILDWEGIRRACNDSDEPDD